VYLTARTFTLFAGVHEWLSTVIYIGGLTALMTATIAIVAVDIKRVLAYSTISQLGLMITAIGIGTETGWFASQFHVMSHALFKALLFLCAGSVMHAVGTTDMREMGGLRRYMPVTFATGTIGVLSLSGVPPFNGFWSKDLIVAALYEEHLFIPLVLVFLASLCTAAYSFRWLHMVFLGRRAENQGSHHPHESPYVMTIPLIILAVAAVGSGFLEGPFLEYLGIEHKVELEIVPVALSLAALVLGFIPTYLVYYRKSVSLDRLRKGVLGRINRTLSEGYYFDRLYYAVFLDGFPRICTLIYQWIETAVIDRFNYAVAGAAQWLSQGFRPSHTGNLNVNISAILAGLLGFFTLALFMIGW
jgi:NADH-quinone oxidoreductase subunit L